MKKVFSTIALTMLAGVGLAQNSALQKAQSALQNRDFNGTISILNEALQNPKTTKFAEMYNLLADAHTRLMEPELQKAAQSQPFDTTGYCVNLDKAIINYTKSYEADNKADEKGKVKPKFNAINGSRIAAMLDYYNYAALFVNQNGNRNEAITYFKKFIELPKNPVFTPQQTDSIYKAKKTEYAQAAYNLTILCYGQNDWDDVLRYADLALQDETRIRDLYIMKMQAYLGKQDSAAYLKTLQEAVIRTETPNFIQNLLYYYIQKDDRAGALSMADNLVKDHPQSKAAYYLRGSVYLNMKPFSYAKAEEDFSKALAIDPNFVEANVGMAYSYMNDVVTQVQNRVIKIPPTYSKLYKQVMETKVQPYYRKALPYFEKVRALLPDEPKRWASPLQQIYNNLDMTEKSKEMDQYLR
jgi:putative tetratricopeptide repeat-containing domain protein